MTLRIAGLFVLASLVPLACGDDGGGDEAATTGAATTGATTSSTGAVEGSSTAIATSGGASTGTTGEAASSSGAVDSSGGPGGDPSYPEPQGGVCPDGAYPVTLPGASVCAPACAGADAACPAAASGDAEPTCTPFAQPGGSETPCTEHGDCTGGEACDPSGICVAVAFWGCRLVCSDGAMCPDGLTCATDACGYP